MVDLSFTFTSLLWLWQGKGAWHFITLPVDKSAEIKFFNANMHDKKRGWGAVRVQATIGATCWQTSIFPSTTLNAYLLPVKLDVRKKEKIQLNDQVTLTLKIDL